MIGNDLETAHTCLYDVVRRQDSVQHCDLSLGPNSGPNYGPKTGPFTRGVTIKAIKARLLTRTWLGRESWVGGNVV